MTKNKDHDEARRIWLQGLTAFPDSADLAERVAVLGDEALLRYVENRRSLEQPIDTDFTFLGRN